ncbi:MAG TPA: hypothetical protein DEP69_05880 [Acidimicrobiaceae bacterium]|nr:hypothetical protein [Acidimicrobiaceae bacterium]
MRPAVAVRSEGAAPLFVRADDDAGTVAATVRVVVDLVAEGHSVLTVAPRSATDKLDAAMARARLDFGRATVASLNATGALHPSVTLATVQLVKGLEADAVVVVEPADIVAEEPRGLGALYVALTRATRQVVVVHAGELPAALAAGAAEPVRARETGPAADTPSQREAVPQWPTTK